MGVNSFPKTITRQRRNCDLNPGPSAPESSMLKAGSKRPHCDNCVCVCAKVCPQNCPFLWGRYVPPPKKSFLRTTRDHIPNGTAIGSSVFVGQIDTLTMLHRMLLCIA